MTELKEAAREHSKRYSSETYKDGSCTVIPSYTARNSFEFGAQWQAKQSPWISVEKEEPPLDKPILVIIDGKPDIITMCDWDYITGYHINITHWMYIPEV